MIVQRILGNDNIKKHLKHIVEFGCAELKFFVYMKNGLSEIETIHMVDIDKELLERCKNRVEPFISDHLKKREVPLTVNLWHGSVSVEHESFKDVDAVVAIEL